jgi:hypothetical protein
MSAGCCTVAADIDTMINIPPTTLGRIEGFSAPRFVKAEAFASRLIG